MLERFRGGERASHKDAMNALQRECASVLDLATPKGGRYRAVEWRDHEGRRCRLASETTIETQDSRDAGKVTYAIETNRFVRDPAKNGIPMEFIFNSNEEGIHFCHENGNVQPLESPNAQAPAIATMMECLAAFPKQQTIDQTQDFQFAWSLNEVNVALNGMRIRQYSFERKITRKVLGVELGPIHEKICQELDNDEHAIKAYYKNI